MKCLVAAAGRKFFAEQLSHTGPADEGVLSVAPQSRTESHPTGR